MRMHALTSLGLRFSRTLLFVGLILFSFASVRAIAAEIIVKNDSIPGSLPLQEMPDGTRLAARLTSPVDGTIVGVQIWWGSLSGLAPPSEEVAIRISEFDGSTYIPAATLAAINAPVLQDSGLNEFRFLDPATGLLPLSVPVSSGEDFFVDLELAPNSYESGDPDRPSLLLDTVAPTSGRNSGFLLRTVGSGGFWVPQFTDAITGVGNFGIRAIIRPVPEPSTYALAAIGAVALLAIRRRKP